MKGAPSLLVLGRGSIGRKHLDNAAALGAEAVSVDPNPDSGAEFRDLEAALRGGRRFSHALVATPPAAHLAGLRRLLQTDVPNILLEKPLCTPEQAAEARGLPKRLLSGRRISMGFNWRFNSAVRQLRAELSSGALGTVQTALFYAREWLPKYGGNVVLESGSHILDTARHLLGDLRVEGAILGYHGLLGDADESASVVLRTADGAGIGVHVNFINKDAYDYRILIQGSLATREYRPDRTEPMHLQELKAFLGGEMESLATWDDGLSNLELIADVFVASKTRKPTPKTEQPHAAR